MVHVWYHIVEAILGMKFIVSFIYAVYIYICINIIACLTASTTSKDSILLAELTCQ